MSEQDNNAVELEVQPPATEENVAPTEKSEPETPPEEQQAETKTFTQEELDRIVQKEKAKLERKHERQRIELETRARIQQEQQIKAPADDPEPKESDYENYSDYVKAIGEHAARRAYRAEKQAEQEKAAKEARMTEEQRQNARQQELIEAGESKYDDFEDVVKADRNEYSRAAYLAMLESDIGAEMLYHLASNPEEGKRIAGLPAFKQAAEIGKLEDKLLAKPKKQISKAPEPITPVSSGKASNDTTLDDNLPIDEWMKRRNKQVFGR
jgi:hypothetical protein